MSESSGTERQEEEGPQKAAGDAAQPGAQALQQDILSGYEDVDFGVTLGADSKEDNEEDDDDDDDEDDVDQEEDDSEEEEEGDEDKKDDSGFMGIDEESGDAATAAAEEEQEDQTAQELARKNRLAQTGYDVRALDTVGWTARYQAVMARPKSTARERMVCAVEERRLFDEFAAHAARIAQRLVHEIHLPAAEKTIKPINSGGVAGGESLLHAHTHTQLFLTWTQWCCSWCW